MRLLITTQIVDRNDRELGFFHEWITVFAGEFERITVICLKEGEHELPENVTVLSLGKESHTSRVRYLARLFRYSWSYRHDYDAVFVHMNQEYPIVAGLLWRLLGKRVTMWRNHFAGNWVTRLAALFCHTVFCTSKYSYTARFKKTVLMPVGVPDQMFYTHDNIERIPRTILSLGRISPAKKLDVLLEGLALLAEKDVAFSATIVGNAFPEYEAYHSALKERAARICTNRGCSISWKAGVPYDETPELYAAHDLFVNLSPSGMYDKTMFEAMLSETLIVSSNKDLKGELRDQFLFTEDDPAELANKVEAILALSGDERARASSGLRAYAMREHTLTALATRLHEELTV